MDPVRNFQNEGVDISDFHNFQTMAFCVVSLSFPLLLFIFGAAIPVNYQLALTCHLTA